MNFWGKRKRDDNDDEEPDGEDSIIPDHVRSVRIKREEIKREEPSCDDDKIHNEDHNNHKRKNNNKNDEDDDDVKRTKTTSSKDLVPGAGVVKKEDTMMTLLSGKKGTMMKYSTDIEVKYSGDMEKLLMEDLFSHDDIVVGKALIKIGEMFWTQQEYPVEKMNRNKAPTIGAHFAILQVMRKWNENEDILSKCCNCLGNILLNRNNECESMAGAILSLGGLEMIVNALKRFPQDIDLYINGGFALTNLFFYKTVCIQPFKKQFVQEYGGVSLMIEKMKWYPNDAEIQEVGCALLQRLAVVEDLKIPLVQCGVFAVAHKIRVQDFGDEYDYVRTEADNLWKTLMTTLKIKDEKKKKNEMNV